MAEVKTAQELIQYGIKDVHYAMLQTGGEKPTWGVPKKVPGAVHLSLTQVGEITKLFADNCVYYQTASNNGYDGESEFSRITDEMLSDIWGMQKNADGVIVETSDDQVKPFALLFRMENDQKGRLFVLYNCTASRPNVEASTTTEAREFNTQTLSFSAAPLADGRVKAITTAETTDEIRNAWFTKVYEPAAA